jgi:hypothetical protein
LITLEPFSFVPVRLYWLGGVSAILGAVFNNLSWYEYGSRRYAFTTGLRGVVPFCTFVVSVPLLVETDAGAVTVALVFVVLQAIAIGVVLPRQRSRWHGAGFDRSTPLRRGYQDSAGFFSLQSLVMLQGRLPVIGAALWFGGPETAAVSVAVSLSEMQAVLAQMRSAITFAEASAEARPRFDRRFTLASVKTLLPGTAAVIVGAIVAREILPSDYGHLVWYVVILTPGVATVAVMASALNVLAVRRELSKPLVAFVIAVAAEALAFSIIGGDALLGALGLWTLCATAGAMVVIVLASRRVRDDVR